MTMNEIMKDALNEYEFYFDNYETDDSETILDSLSQSLNDHDYQNNPYLINALRVYYQLTKNRYIDPGNEQDKHESKTILKQIQNYFKKYQIEV